uniref:Katanin p80 subunit C-terminal domain-containing protein n=1 Tax=Acrobeloides nanus TaxID=290746 RepID=A0A914CA02_9BILA
MKKIFEERVPSPIPEIGTICTNSERVIVANPLREFGYNPLNTSKAIPLLDEKARCLRLSKDQRYLAAASHAISIVDLEKGMNIRQLVGHDNWVTGICEHRFNSYIWATVSADLTVIDLSFHPEEYLMAATSEDKIIRFWDLESRECVSQSHPFETVVKRILFEPTGRHLIAASNKNLTATRWEPFDIIGQISLPSTSSADTNPLSARLSTETGLNTLDLCVHNGYLLHLGISTCDGNLNLSSVSLNKLEMPSVTKVSHSTSEKGMIPPTSFHSASSIFDPSNRNFQAQISVEDLDLEMANLNSESEPSTPCDEQYPSRPESAASDYAGRGSQERIGENMSVVWKASSVNDGFKIVKKNPTSAPTAPVSGSIKRRGESPTTTGATIKPSRSRSTNSNNLQGNEIPRSGFRAPSLSRPNLNEVKATISPSKSTSTLASKPKKNEQAKSVKPPISSPCAPKSSRVAPVEKAKVSRMSSSEQSKSVANQKSEMEKMHEIIAGHSKIMNLLSKRKINIKKVAASIKAKRSENEVLGEAASQEEPHVLASLMERYKDHPSAYSLNFAASVLPKLRNVLQHPNSDYIDVGLHTLEVLVANFGNTIRQGANANASAIGVDIAAEQRRERCEKCRKALMDLQLNSSFIVDRMSAEQQLKFNVLMPKVEEITS